MKMQKERVKSAFPNSGRKLLLLAHMLPLLLLLVGFLPSCVLAEKKKILCLHGGGDNGEGFAASPGMKDLERALTDFEFVYANAGYPVVVEEEYSKKEENSGGYLWIPDPPGGKKEPTQDPAVSQASTVALDEIVASDGPFAGILGYSQGAAYAPFYVSTRPDTFEFALMFCGYPTLTHLGMLGVVQDSSPNPIPSLIWMGANDFLIPPEFTRETIPFFESPLVVESDQGDHAVPGTDDPTFDQVLSFIESQSNGASDDSAGSSSSTSIVMIACLIILGFATVSI